MAEGSKASLVYPFTDKQFVSSLTPFGGKLLLLAGSTIWVTNGARAGTKALGSLPADFGSFGYPDPIVPAGRRAFIVGSRQIWITDGTRSGTHLVIRMPEITDGYGDAGSATTVGSTLFFSARDGIHGMELWKSDGTASGTTMLRISFPAALAHIPGSQRPPEASCTS